MTNSVKQWFTTSEKIRNVIAQEQNNLEYGSISNSSKAQSLFAQLYANYIPILNDVSNIFDQTMQVQKRLVLERILVAVAIRVCELKRQLCEIEMSEYIYIDRELICARLAPSDISVNRLSCFSLQRSSEYNQIIDKHLRRSQSFAQSVPVDQLISIEPVRTETEIEYTFYDMLESHIPRNPSIENAEQDKRSQLETFQSEFEQTVLDTKADILRKKTYCIKEYISDFVRNWFRETYEAAGDFDVYPTAAIGGSIAIVKGETMTPQEFGEFRTTGKRKQEKKEMPAKPTANKKKGSAKKEWDFTVLSPSLVALENAMQAYEAEWNSVDEISNKNEKPYMDLILPTIYAEVHQELHAQVDEAMRVEHELLRAARCKDLQEKYKKPKAKRDKKEKKKKGKEEKTPTKDITGDRSHDCLIAELVENGILIDVPEKSFEDFFGDLNYTAYEKRNADDMTDPPPCLGELKSTIRSWILGMGSLDVDKAKSICLSGPPGCGKKHIIYAVANELGAVVLNLSSDVVCKFEDNMPYFVHLVTKMARNLQPCVLFIDEAHKPFIKKAPTPELKATYKLLGKFLPKIKTAIKADDRILILGATNEPWNAAMPKLKQCYEKFVLIPTEQYADKLLIWKKGIQQRVGFIPDIEISSLARVNIEYSTSSILNAIDQVLTTSRINILRSSPLRTEEFMYAMNKQDPPISKQILEKHRKWFVKVDKLAKARNAIMIKQKKRK